MIFRTEPILRALPLFAVVPDVSVVIATYQRPAACVRAIESALSQDPSPLEVLVCDDGSTDETQAVMEEWARREIRVRYFRTPFNRGTPGPSRNLGTIRARGAWVAYLDDDDAWLPGKLACQLELASDADLIGTNAIRGDGSLYFGDAPHVRWLTRGELLADNPMIVSSVIVRRDAVLAAGGFPTQRWARGVADYALWLALADRGTRAAVLGEPFVRYETEASDRMSLGSVKQEVAAARLMWQRARRRPFDRDVRRAALNRTFGAAALAARRL